MLEPAKFSKPRYDWTVDEVLDILSAPFMDLVYAAATVHRMHFDPDEVQVSSLLSIKTGSCPEDCKYCPQSAYYKTGLIKESLLAYDTIMAKAKLAKEHGATRFCMGAAWRNPKERDMPFILQVIRGVKSLGLETCMTLGMLTKEQAGELAEAGLDIVFLQFDGTQDEIYRTLRGRPLLETKLEAIRVCSSLQVGVTLVPTVVKGVNDQNLGELVALARDLSPAVRGIHFQPVSYFGRYPGVPAESDRYTLDQLMADICDQAQIPPESFMPSRCDHPLCGFHASFLIDPKGGLKPLSSITHSSHSRGQARDNREYVARHWRRYPDEPPPVTDFSGEMDFDTFLYRLRHHSLTLSAMAFQDAMNLNIERLHRCSLHVYDQGKIKPFCAKYLSRMD